MPSLHPVFDTGISLFTNQVVTASLYQENVAAPRVVYSPVRFPVVWCVLPLCVVLCVKSHCDLPAIAARPGGLFALSTNA